MPINFTKDYFTFLESRIMNAVLDALSHIKIKIIYNVYIKLKIITLYKMHEIIVYIKGPPPKIHF